jgi:hypothetical protein
MPRHSVGLIRTTFGADEDQLPPTALTTSLTKTWCGQLTPM